ncbi:MAG: 23S rRNA (cytidine1920-2'-O)/16S rRNA (cytidine1409-2'-O)-methyltransferase [Phormidesmis priestleyi Ana]|uniref:23S rRNA (Cytidine1920-2'-O)/16S rRNA (Cytidine1409-2'-O)-methyltransferase n=1 Tax=Phormidesmis priestleyi Ana TaxID=1666911 RepID=A0A0P8A1I4_9CYAN|nr:MAG: 23S rRNA (cytidine1920-2'-O)/16S rRNA (cytidine1409-2'-O)-methyltransferase [Phormidesmis priestleyi Ana]
MAKQRLDTLLVEQGLCPSRQLAQRLIRAGEVKIDQQVIDKPGTLIATDAVIVLKQKPPYVSRGGEKLARALKIFNVQPKGKICLDGGISTGGFTDCLLQAEAKQVYGVDVGYGQVAWKIRQDPRVVLRERTNIRHLTPEDLYAVAAESATNEARKMPTLGVMDVSFISLVKVLPAFWSLLAHPREVVLLVKPQFEVGRDKIGKKGVVRDPKDQAIAILQVTQAAAQLGWHYRGLTWSETVGPAGNIEYLLWLCSDQKTQAYPELSELCEVTQAARQALSK